MRFDPTASRETVLEQLRQDAELSFGAERLEALAPFLEATASAIARLGAAALDPFDEEPDLLAAGGPRA